MYFKGERGESLMVYSVAHWITRLFFNIFFRLQAIGLEHIPKDGAVIVCCNHISILDPCLLGARMTRKINYMAKAELFRFPLFSWFLGQVGAFPVKRGGVSKDAIRISLQILKEDRIL